jgi:hypothetical protein
LGIESPGKTDDSNIPKIGIGRNFGQAMENHKVIESLSFSRIAAICGPVEARKVRKESTTLHQKALGLTTEGFLFLCRKTPNQEFREQ